MSKDTTPGYKKLKRHSEKEKKKEICRPRLHLDKGLGVQLLLRQMMIWTYGF